MLKHDDEPSILPRSSTDFGGFGSLFLCNVIWVDK